MSLRLLARLWRMNAHKSFNNNFTNHRQFNSKIASCCSPLPIKTTLCNRYWRKSTNNINLIKCFNSSTFSRDDGRDDLEASTNSDDLLEPDEMVTSDDDDILLVVSSVTDETLTDALQHCQSFAEIMKWINHRCSIEPLSQQQIVKAVLALWEHTKATNLDDHAESKDFQNFLQIIAEKSANMSAEELSICLLYLSKMGVSMHDTCMNKLLQTILELLKNDAEEFSLSALSRFTVAISSAKELYTFLVCRDAIPRIYNYLETVNKGDDLRLVTICLNSLHQLVTVPILDLYKEKVIEIYGSSSSSSPPTLTPDATKCLLKIIQFLNYPHWSQKNSVLLRQLVLQLKDQIATFHMKELEQIFKVFQSQLEPAELTAAITERAQCLFEQTPTAELLACSVMYALPDKRSALTERAKEFIYSAPNDSTAASALPTLFKILRFLKISNVYICDGYWSRVLATIRANASERESYILARHCHRYMHFNNNLGGTYRHKEFEKYVVSLLMAELSDGITALIPSKFAKVAAFVVAYGHTANDRNEFPSVILRKMEAMQGQFKIVDCLQLSRGIQIALQMRFKRQISAELSAQLVRIEQVLNACAERHLAEKDLTIEQLNSILRAFTNRQTSTKTQIFHEIVKRYEQIPNRLSSRIIREITFNLNASKCLMSTVCAKLMDYIVVNEQFVLGDTVEKVLYCCYNLGFIPQSDAVLDSAVKIINRDFNYMNGLSIVQACLALCFYKKLPENLINRVFNIEFIKRLEDEIEMCYSKGTYPERVLNQVMQLNRAVCLDFPAANVPWFQQNYIEAQMTKLPTIKNKFHVDIKQMLMSFVGEQSHLKIDHVTPYGYRIDFVVHFDSNYTAVPVPKREGIFDNITKVAILLLKIDAFCQNNRNQLRGREILRQRHLEMLGYRVVQISFNDWNAMYMSLPGAKLNYLKKLLQIPI